MCRITAAPSTPLLPPTSPVAGISPVKQKGRLYAGPKVVLKYFGRALVSYFTPGDGVIVGLVVQRIRVAAVERNTIAAAAASVHCRSARSPCRVGRAGRRNQRIGYQQRAVDGTA